MGEGRRGTRVRAAPPISGRLPMAVPRDVLDLRTGGPDPALLPAATRLRPAREGLADRYGRVHRLSSRLRPGRLAASSPPRESTLRASRLSAEPSTASSECSGRGCGQATVSRSRIPVTPRCSIFSQRSAYRLVPVGRRRPGRDPGASSAALDTGWRRPCSPRVHRTRPARRGTRLGRASLREVLDRHPDVLVVEDDHAGPAAGVPLNTSVRGPHPMGDDPVGVEMARARSAPCGPCRGPTTVSRVEGRQALGTGWVSYLLQEIVAELWSDRERRTEAPRQDGDDLRDRAREALVRSPSRRRDLHRPQVGPDRCGCLSRRACSRRRPARPGNRSEPRRTVQDRFCVPVSASPLRL